MTTANVYVREALFEDGEHICPCCKNAFDSERKALDCCLFAGAIHLKEEQGDTESICGIEAHAEDPLISETLGEDFDPNGFCHFCLGEDVNN